MVGVVVGGWGTLACRTPPPPPPPHHHLWVIDRVGDCAYSASIVLHRMVAACRVETQVVCRVARSKGHMCNTKLHGVSHTYLSISCSTDYQLHSE